MSGAGRIHICSTSVGLDELTKKQAGDWRRVLTVLEREKRFSVFEATANQTIANTMDGLLKERLITVDNSPGFPWSNVALTNAGRAYLAKEPRP